eukprot:scaffold17594_cov35-Tisochrysis_lutea.AAC.2
MLRVCTVRHTVLETSLCPHSASLLNHYHRWTHHLQSQTPRRKPAVGAGMQASQLDVVGARQASCQASANMKGRSGSSMAQGVEAGGRGGRRPHRQTTSDTPAARLPYGAGVPRGRRKSRAGRPHQRHPERAATLYGIRPAPTAAECRRPALGPPRRERPRRASARASAPSSPPRHPWRGWRSSECHVGGPHAPSSAKPRRRVAAASDRPAPRQGVALGALKMEMGSAPHHGVPITGCRSPPPAYGFPVAMTSIQH